MSKEYAVVIRKNDRESTLVDLLAAKLNKEQADEISRRMNGAFASQGVKWYATVAEREE